MATTQIFDVGDQPTATYTVEGSAGPVDPTTVSCIVRKPDRSRTVYVFTGDPELVRTGIGVYEIEIPLDQAGKWVVRFEAEGAVVDANEQRFYVRDQAA